MVQLRALADLPRRGGVRDRTWEARTTSERTEWMSFRFRRWGWWQVSRRLGNRRLGCGRKGSRGSVRITILAMKRTQAQELPGRRDRSAGKTRPATRWGRAERIV